MFTQHPVFQQPPDENIRVWRYLDFTKFVDLLDTRSLYFCRADRFEDRFEGSYPQFNVKNRSQMWGGDKGVPDEMLKVMSGFSRKFRTCIGINCWHANPHESAAMWRLYLKSHEGIAIQSTYALLRDSFADIKEEVYVGLVRYIDYETEWMPEGNSFYPFVHKRKSFAHENEVRAIVCRFPTKAKDVDMSKEWIGQGVNLPIDPKRLISRVFIAPDSPTWFTLLIKSVTRKYGIEVPIVSSVLASEPVY